MNADGLDGVFGVDLRHGRRLCHERLCRAVGAARLDTDNGGLAPHDGLGGQRGDNGVLAVDGRSNTSACETRGDAGAGVAAAHVGGCGCHRVPEVWHEEVLLGGCVRAAEARGGRHGGNGGNGWDQQIWGLRAGAVRDAGNVGNLDDVGSAGEDGRRHRSNGVGGGPGAPPRGKVVLLLLLRGRHVHAVVPILLFDPRASLALQAELPDHEDQDGDEGHAADDTACDGSYVWFPGAGVGALSADAHALCLGAGVAGLARLDAVAVAVARAFVGASRRLGRADDTALEDGAHDMVDVGRGRVDGAESGMARGGRHGDGRREGARWARQVRREAASRQQRGGRDG